MSLLRVAIVITGVAGLLSGLLVLRRKNLGFSPTPARLFNGMRLGDEVALKRHVDEIARRLSVVNRNIVSVPARDRQYVELESSVHYIIPRADSRGLDEFSVAHSSPLMGYLLSISMFRFLMHPILRSKILSVSPLPESECREALFGVFMRFPRMDREIVHNLFTGRAAGPDREILVSLDVMEALGNSDIDGLMKGYVIHSLGTSELEGVSAEGVRGFKNSEVECVRVARVDSPEGDGIVKVLQAQDSFGKLVNTLLDSFAETRAAMLTPKAVGDLLNKIELFMREDGTEGPIDAAEKTRRETESRRIEDRLTDEYVQSVVVLDASSGGGGASVGGSEVAISGSEVTIRTAPYVFAPHVVVSLELSFLHYLKAQTGAVEHVKVREVLTQDQCRDAMNGVFLSYKALNSEEFKRSFFPELFNSNDGNKAEVNPQWPDPNNVTVLLSVSKMLATANIDALLLLRGVLLVAIEKGKFKAAENHSNHMGSSLTYSSFKVSCVRLVSAVDSDGRIVSMPAGESKELVQVLNERMLINKGR